MEKPKKFVTLFYRTKNVHLIKDVGMIPYYMHKKYGSNSYVVTYNNNKEYAYLNSETKGLNLQFLKELGKIKFCEKSVLKYIWEDAKNINILNLYHFSVENYVYGILYKIVNPKGTLYLKTDLEVGTFKRERYFTYSKNKIKQFILSRLEEWFLNIIDIISIETKEGMGLLKRRFEKIASKFIYLPNGIDSDFVEKNFGAIKKYDEKENIIITVGRIGAYEKNNEMLLKAIKRINLKDWKVYFIGPIENDFQIFIENFYASNANLKNNVIFTGEISDRTKLYEFYNRARIFCLTSMYESFGIVLVEALYFGNYLVLTPTSAANDVTKNGELGSIIDFDDVESLASKIQNLINNPEIIVSKYAKIISHSRENFVWGKIIEELKKKCDE